MTEPFSFAGAFLIGLLGSTHCIGMCGGIASALSIGTAMPKAAGLPGPLVASICYNLGRITSYAIAGLVAGFLGQRLSGFGLVDGFPVGQAISTLFMVALGMYLMGFSWSLAWLEKAGSRIWRLVEPLARRLLPLKSVWQAIPLGMLWGWLPCGLVYSVLGWSAVAGGATNGALIMLGFGLGTLPMLMLLGGSGRWLAARLRQTRIRQLAGALIVGGALSIFLITLLGDGGSGAEVHRH